MKEEYLYFIFVAYIRSTNFDELFGEGWVDEEVLPNLKLAAIKEAFELRGFSVNPLNFEAQFDAVFQEVLSGGGFVVEGDELLGRWYRLDRDFRAKVVKDMLSRSSVARKLNNLGETSFEALRRAISKIVADGNLVVDDSDASEPTTDDPAFAPAADRIVRFTDNQITDAREPLDDLISQIEKENSISGETGLRELILGQLKAGRELLEAGIASLRSIELTLIVGLKLLIERYKEHAIGAVAGQLLELIVEAIGAS